MTGSVAIIGAGQIGFAAVSQFLLQGWAVSVCARNRPNWPMEGATFHSYDKLHDAPPQADVVIDTIAFDADDVERYDPGAIGRLIVVSSASVYCDDQGRTLDEAAEQGFPDFGGPIDEGQPITEAGPQNYSTRKVRMENAVQNLFGDRATILRPCAIHGLHSRHPREWWFVKRMLDGRQRIPLMYNGASQFQPTSATLIGRFSQHAAKHNIGGIFNLADGNCPNVLEIGQTIANILQAKPQLVPIEADEHIGRTPWSTQLPFVLGGHKTDACGFDRAPDYACDVEKAVLWLRDLNQADWKAAFPVFAAYPFDPFDYEAEDRLLASL